MGNFDTSTLFIMKYVVRRDQDVCRTKKERKEAMDCRIAAIPQLCFSHQIWYTGFAEVLARKRTPKLHRCLSRSLVHHESSRCNNTPPLNCVATSQRSQNAGGAIPTRVSSPFSSPSSWDDTETRLYPMTFLSVGRFGEWCLMDPLTPTDSAGRRVPILPSPLLLSQAVFRLHNSCCHSQP